jgi:hypothetical protein
MHTLCAPITENAKDGKPLHDSYYMANKIALIVDLLCFFVEHHNINMRTYTVQKNLLQSVLVYLESKHHFLAHCKSFLIWYFNNVVSLSCTTIVATHHWPEG